MGLFSKKTYVCEKCGQEFEKRINTNGNLCDKCHSEEIAEKAKLKDSIGGYCSYASYALLKDYSSEEMKQIIAHRDGLLNKFRLTDVLSKNELMIASDNYDKLTDDEAASVLLKAAKSTIYNITGAGYSNDFFVLTQFDEIIVDAKDVFAVGMTTDPRDSVTGGEAILCAVFTNDPYVPVFPMTFVGKKSFLELTKSKKGREEIKQKFGKLCPNLTYPVCDLAELKKTVKKDGAVKGKIASDKMQEIIADAMSGRGIFNTKQVYFGLSEKTASMMESIGYIQREEIDAILKMDKKANGNYWNKQLQRLLNNPVG